MAESLLDKSNGLSISKLSSTTASASDVVSGKTFYSGDKNLKTGSLSLYSATASAADVLSGKTFYAGNTTLKTGTLNLGSKVSIIEIDAPPQGNEYRNGSSSYNTGKQILWCPIKTFLSHADGSNNQIQITSYSNGIIYYNWRVHNIGILAYVPVIFA